MPGWAPAAWDRSTSASPRPGGAVAIKVVHPQLARDQEFLQRFSREVAAARAVSGMYTAPVVGSGLNDTRPGSPLRTCPVRRWPRSSPGTGRCPSRRSGGSRPGWPRRCSAVHAVGLVHRDLKPANVLLADDGPHVIDFGISRAFQGTQLTSAGMVVGTPGYMSPEQAEGAPSGPPSDVFSLGCVLAYAATGNAAVRRGHRRVNPVPGRADGARPGHAPGRAAPAGRGLPAEGPRPAAGPGPADRHDRRARPGHGGVARLVLARGGGPRHRGRAGQPDAGPG